MEMRRRRLGTGCGVEGVSRTPFIGQGRERRGHGRAGTACTEGAAKLPLSWQFYPLVNAI
jgi:hypothetical protein